MGSPLELVLRAVHRRFDDSVGLLLNTWTCLNLRGVRIRGVAPSLGLQRRFYVIVPVLAQIVPSNGGPSTGSSVG